MYYYCPLALDLIPIFLKGALVGTHAGDREPALQWVRCPFHADSSSGVHFFAPPPLSGIMIGPISKPPENPRLSTAGSGAAS